MDAKNHFRTLTPGKLAGLRQITDAEGRFKVLAMDQSNSFKKSLRKLHEVVGRPAEPTYAEIRDTKVEMTQALSPLASALLLDVNFGLRQALSALSFPKTVGLIGRVEASKNAGLPGDYEPGWGVAQIKKMGCAAVKLLVYMDVEDETATRGQMDFVKKVHKACAEQDILLMTEELSYPRAGETKDTPAYQARLVKNIVESAKLIGPYTDILKLEFPGFIRTDSKKTLTANLARLDAAAVRPWVILSAGEKFELFVTQVELALKAGCSGYMAGRAIFNEYFEQKTPAARAKFLKTTGVKRMKTLNALVDKHADGWPKRLGLKGADLAGAVDANWYLASGAASAPQTETAGAY